ncbi:hypothetical protein B0I35DRAFT_483648 [Stachybotrys elegans]|uniref:Uncharacterized protein n=1 Tax=Stachybotrys elegans TaxID=80388 RepID=A0A8K0SJM7_9HYPO|nr:hypothetical protein B0I35DRAFT_483648 [Stachybotrys elegans]
MHLAAQFFVGVAAAQLDRLDGRTAYGSNSTGMYGISPEDRARALGDPEATAGVRFATFPDFGWDLNLTIAANITIENPNAPIALVTQMSELTMHLRDRLSTGPTPACIRIIDWIDTPSVVDEINDHGSGACTAFGSDCQDELLSAARDTGCRPDLLSRSSACRRTFNATMTAFWANLTRINYLETYFTELVPEGSNRAYDDLRALVDKPKAVLIATGGAMRGPGVNRSVSRPPVTGLSCLTAGSREEDSQGATVPYQSLVTLLALTTGLSVAINML